MATIQTKNPATNKDLSTFTKHTTEEVQEIINKADKTYQSYKKTSFTDRAVMMHKAADILEERKAVYAETMTLEMGKTLSSAIGEVEKCAWVCRYYADNAESFMADEMVDTDATRSMISYRPIGIVLAVMPWNYPMWQVFRFAAPALMAGNVGLLKHASNVPQSALYIEEVFRDAGFPEGCFTTLLVDSSGVKPILENKKVKAATLTGSGPAGSAVASTAGSQIKHTVLELGGSDPYLVLHDADLEHAAEQCKTSRLLNAGQSCIGAKRFIIVDEVYDEFLALFKSKMESAIMGDPMTQVTLGPMARHDLRDEVHGQVVESVKNGATLLIGGHIPEGEGAYYPPTILTDVKPGMPAYEDEIFGPVASVIRAKDEEDAIRIANDTDFGLGACVFTRDVKRGEQIAKERLDAGCCFVNQFVKSDPRLPFGGVKTSGVGRELSYYGIREFVNVKTIFVK
ncbi:MAG: succinate-semialdehyde dehydrogenase/glutarate-semialdehyde dehydrogenase [Saprospiraceae bacterium]|jgi:succinate-semialdehyde dehydrogenase/glutarate-semialdehyde dehydrogenase